MNDMLWFENHKHLLKVDMNVDTNLPTRGKKTRESLFKT